MYCRDEHIFCDDLSLAYDAANENNVSSARLTAGLKSYLRLSEKSNVATMRVHACARVCKYIKLLRM